MWDVIGHEGIVRELAGLAAQAEPPHALLFAGPEGTGRRRLALEYARLLNCERIGDSRLAIGDSVEPPTPSPQPLTPCGQCRTCRLIGEGLHPDVLVLGPGELLCTPRSGDSGHEKHPLSRDIRICQVRGMIDLVARFPVEARFRVIVIDPAERLRPEASNTLLKTLEEPPEHTAICLVTGAPEAVLETIRSRCRRIDVHPVAREAIVAGLLAGGVEAGIAEAAAEAARGRPARAIKFAGQPDLLADKGRLLARCRTLAGQRAAERFRYASGLVDRYRKDRADVDHELDIWEEFWEAELRARASETADEGASEVLEVAAALQAIGRAREDLLANVQTRLALELMLLSFPRRTLETAHEDRATADE